MQFSVYDYQTFDQIRKLIPQKFWMPSNFLTGTGISSANILLDQVCKLILQKFWMPSNFLTGIGINRAHILLDQVRKLIPQKI